MENLINFVYVILAFAGTLAVGAFGLFVEQQTGVFTKFIKLLGVDNDE